MAETQGWARLVAGLADEAITGTVQDIHRAISHGAFRVAGRLGRPVERAHDVVVDRAYATVRTGIRAIGELGAAIAGQRTAGGPSPAALRARSIALGSIDERFLSVAPALDAEVALHADGQEVRPEAPHLAGAFPEANSHVAVFLHGLVQSENGWDPGEREGIILPAVAAELGVTPLLLRYGTGRPIARNGADVAELLEAIAATWPAPIERITIVGHSMGGLVAQAAGVVARERHHLWADAVTDIVHIGTPHRGSWLEKVATGMSSALTFGSPASAPIGRMIDGRSQGIKDLRFGTFVAATQDPTGGDTGTGGSTVAHPPLDPPFTGVEHHLVVGRLRSGDRHPLNLLFGDGLVRSRSAAGISDAGGAGTVVPVDARHTRLLHHPAVGELLRGVLSEDRRVERS